MMAARRFHRAVKEAFYAVAFCGTFKESLDQLQRPSTRIVFYNRGRAHQGYRTQGRAPFRPLPQPMSKALLGRTFQSMRRKYFSNISDRSESLRDD
jgi:hypothetical protein